MKITCISCSEQFPYPVEYLELNDADRAYLEDDFCCEPCWKDNEDKKYYNNGIAELNGY